MRFVSISLDPSRIRVQRKVVPDLEVFEATGGCNNLDYRKVCIPKTYHRLGEWALAEGLGRETIVMQDDVWVPHGPGFDHWISEWAEVPLLILGQTEKSGAVAPKAFSATPEIWSLLAGVWTGEGRIIPAWMPIVEEHGTVLNVCQSMGG